MIDVLEKIAQHKTKEVAQSKAETSVKELKQKPLFLRSCYSAKKAIQDNEFGIIAEFKRKSPSKPNINLTAKPEDVILSYAENGAAAISVLTDKDFFGGSIDYLPKVRDVKVPLLRKDFVVDAYQIYEAKAYGADFILLIAAILTQQQIQEFTDLAHELGMEVLLEFHAGEEFQKLYDKVDLVGINNRNLRTFQVELAHSIKMRSQLGNSICIAESGIHSVEDYLKLKRSGFNGFLMGEYFMKHENPAETLQQFIQKIKNEN